ncbi:MAG: ABC transporter substrate-binding protein [Deinococcota bacterium]
MKKLLSILIFLLLSTTFAQTFPVTVTDSFGHELTFDAPPERMVCLVVHCITVMSFIEEAPDAIVRFPDGFNDVIFDERYFEQPQDDVALIPTLGDTFEQDYEAILSFEPDFAFVNNSEQYDALSGFVSTYQQNFEADPLELFFLDVRNMARIYGKEAEVEAKIQALLDRAEAYGTVSESSKTFLNGFAWDDELSSMQLWTYDIACPFLVPEDACYSGGEFTAEGVLEINPDVLIIEVVTEEDAANVQRAFEEDPLWAELPAYQNDQVLIINRVTDIARPTTPKAFELWLDFVVPLMYPEAFPNGPLTDEQVQEILANQ